MFEVWSTDAIADTVASALQQRDADLRAEQSVYGLDVLPELALHTLIAGGLSLSTQHSALSTPPWGVLREQPYPHEWFRKLKPDATGLSLPLPRDRMRCDIVLTPEPNQTLDDSLLTEKQRRAEAKELEGTLFESLSASHLAPGAADPSHLPTSPPSHLLTTPPESAFWLEIKLTGQFTSTSGLPGPNRTYASELTRNPITDLKKLAADHRIHHAGVLIVLFTADERTATHDLAVLAHRVLDKDIPIASPAMRHFPIPDRIGNTTCTVCVLALRKD